MSNSEIIAAVISTVLVGVAGVFLFISKQRAARQDMELRSMLQPKGRLDIDSARTVHKKGLFGMGSRSRHREDDPGDDELQSYLPDDDDGDDTRH